MCSMSRKLFLQSSVNVSFYFEPQDAVIRLYKERLFLSSEIMIQSSQGFLCSRGKAGLPLYGYVCFHFCRILQHFFSDKTGTDRHRIRGWKARLGDDISLHDYSVWCNHGYMLQIFLLYLAYTWSHSWAMWGRRKAHKIHQNTSIMM